MKRIELYYTDFGGKARECIQFGYAEAIKQIHNGQTTYIVSVNGMNNYTDSEEEMVEWLERTYDLMIDRHRHK